MVRAHVDKWHAVLRLYRAQQWDGAQSLLDELKAHAPEDKLFEIYSERIASYRMDPPPADWDGVKKFESK
jgi:adenylate cyclase